MSPDVPVSIRPAQENDLTEIAALDRGSGLTPWKKSDYRVWLDRGDAVFLSALAPGRLVGFILLRAAAGEAELLKIAADAAARGLGIGQSLLTAGIRAVRSVGCQTVFLEVRPTNAAALRLYQKTGFVQVGRRPDYYRNPQEDALVMRLDL